MDTHQSTFEKNYITSIEIGQILSVPRATIAFGKNNGKLPNPIEIAGKITIWERESIMPFITSWKESLEKRRTKK